MLNLKGRFVTFLKETLNIAVSSTEEEEEGGITWIELYLLYARHGGNEDGVEEKRKEKSFLKI